MIRRCLGFGPPLIDYWLIVEAPRLDQQKEDQAIIREHLKDLPGELLERPGQGLAHRPIRGPGAGKATCRLFAGHRRRRRARDSEGIQASQAQG